ncbi:hypothetical protein PMEGAPL128_33630 [Priestia megaterium]
MITDKHFLNAVNNTNVDFTGWDFSIITRTGRMDSDMLSWSYGSEAFRLIQDSNAALDMGTNRRRRIFIVVTAFSSRYVCYRRI